MTPGYQKTVQVGIKKMYPDVVAPEYKHDGDACCDIRAYRVVKMMNDMGVEIDVPSDLNQSPYIKVILLESEQDSN